MKSISAFTLLVKDYDEAIAYYTKTLGFVLVEDTKIDEKKRWVMIAPSRLRTH
jgi:catechol 2,3-dioxygenase-like lactoylglutathione lyase family enzyme